MKADEETGSTSRRRVSMVDRWMRDSMRRSQNSSSSTWVRKLPLSTTPSFSRQARAYTMSSRAIPSHRTNSVAVSGPEHSTQLRITQQMLFSRAFSS